MPITLDMDGNFRDDPHWLEQHEIKLRADAIAQRDAQWIEALYAAWEQWGNARSSLFRVIERMGLAEQFAKRLEEKK